MEKWQLFCKEKWSEKRDMTNLCKTLELWMICLPVLDVTLLLKNSLLSMIPVLSPPHLQVADLGGCVCTQISDGVRTLGALAEGLKQVRCMCTHISDRLRITGPII